MASIFEESDNPVQKALEALFGKSSSKSSVVNYIKGLKSLLVEQGIPEAELPRTASLISRTDKYGILRRASEFKDVTSSFRWLPAQLTHFAGVKVIQRGKGEVYIGSTTLGFVPMPALGGAKPRTLEAGIVQIGAKKRAAYQVSYLNAHGLTKATYAELWYNKLRSIVAELKSDPTQNDLERFMRRVGSIGDTVIGTGVKGEVRLKELLTPGPVIRGLSDSALSAMYRGAQSMVIDPTGRDPGLRTRKLPITFYDRHEVFRMHEKYNQARGVINAIVKTRGTYIPTDVPFVKEMFALGQPPTADRVLREAFRITDEYAAFIPKIFETLRIKGLHPLGKADFLIDAEKNLLVPTPLLGDIFGNQFSERMQKKGGHQLFRASPITRSVAATIMKSGGRPVPYVMPTGEMANVPGGMIATRRPFRVAVLDFNTDVLEKTIVGDSGALLTTRGLASTAKTQYIATLNVAGPSEKFLASIEVLTGKKGLNQVGRLSFSTEELRAALAYNRASSEFVPFKALTAREKALRQFASFPGMGKYIGVLEGIAKGTLSGVERGEGVRLSTTLEGTTLKMNLLTARATAASHVGMVMGGVRFTGIPARIGNILSSFLDKLNNLGGATSQLLGVDAVISATDFDKMMKLDVFLENFYATVDRYGLHNEISGSVKGFDKQVSRVVGTKSFDIATGSSKIALAKQAMRAIKMLKRQGGAKAQIAAEMLKKKTVDVRGLAVRKNYIPGLELGEVAGVAGQARIVTMPGFVRSDQRMDTNTLKRAKLTSGKFKTLAMGSGLLGYATPMEDPIIRALSFQQRMFKWDPTKQDFVLSESHPIRRFLKDVTQPGKLKAPPPDKVVSFRNGKLFLGDRELKNLPDIQAFGGKNGGVAVADLKGTLLDPSIDDYFYLDLGKEKKLAIVGRDAEGKVVFDGLRHRYIPISKQLLMTEEFIDATGRMNLEGPRRLKDVDGRLVAGKKHSAYNFIQLINEMQTRGRISPSLIAATMKGFLTGLTGKKGLLAKMATIHLDAGYRGRLVPQMTTFDTLKNFLKPRSVFTGAISRKQFLSVLEARKGMMAPEVYESLLKQGKTGRSVFATLIADPTQRPEHMSLFRLKLLDQEIQAAGKVRIAELGLDVQMHPLAYKMYERDNDLDAITVNFLDKVNYKARELRDRITRQSRAIAPALRFFEDKLLVAKAPGQKELIQDIISAFIGQKAYASLGFTAVRPTLERLVPKILEGGEAFERTGFKFGVGSNLTLEELGNIRSMFGTGVTAVREFAGATAVSTFILQSGVKKGTAKAAAAEAEVGLRELMIGLVSLSEETSRVGLNLEKSLKQAHELFYKFVSGADTNRIFQAGQLLEDMGGSLPKVLLGLEEGLQRGSKEFLNRRAASLLAKTVGLGFILGKKVPNAYTLAGMMEDTLGEMHFTTSSLMKRVVGPITGVYRLAKKKIKSVFAEPTGPTGPIGPGPTGPVTGTGPAPSSRAAAAEKKTLLESLETLSKTRNFRVAATVAGIAAGIGLLNRATAPDFNVPLPPPSDTTTPMDRGPALPSSFKPVPRIYGSSGTPSASNRRSPYSPQSINTNFMRKGTNTRLIIDDNVSSRQNSWLLRRQIDKESGADFAY